MKQHIAEELIQYSALMETKGFVNALEGNLSIIDRETGDIYITPSGTRKLYLDLDTVAVVDKQGKQYAGSRNHSKEVILHQRAYEIRPDCNAAIHCHATFLTAYAFLNQPITNDADIGFSSCFGEIPVVPFGIPASAEIAENLGTYLEKNDIVLLANHGVLCVGKDMEQCAKMLEAAEAMVKSSVISRLIGKPQLLPEAVLKLVRKA